MEENGNFVRIKVNDPITCDTVNLGDEEVFCKEVFILVIKGNGKVNLKQYTPKYATLFSSNPNLNKAVFGLIFVVAGSFAVAGSIIVIKLLFSQVLDE